MAKLHLALLKATAKFELSLKIRQWAANTRTAAATESAKHAANSPKHKFKLSLNVYKIGGSFGGLLGIYHSGLVVEHKNKNGKIITCEYYFDGVYDDTPQGGTGVRESKPGTWSSSGVYTSIELGYTPAVTLYAIIKQVECLSSKWGADSYDLRKNNCNDFSMAAARKMLGKQPSIPAWINQLASRFRFTEEHQSIAQAEQVPCSNATSFCKTVACQRSSFVSEDSDYEADDS